MYLQPHHTQVIERLTAQFKDDPRYPALIVGGSLVKGWGGVNSDVDIMLVATDEEYARCAANDNFWYYNAEICDYPGGYVDGKIINMQFLNDVADHGSEPARAAFTNVFLAYSRIPELAELLPTIPVYQEAEREEKIYAFYSQVQMQHWFIKEAEQKQALYLMAHATSEMVFYAARLLLAYNRRLYPYHKWLMQVVKEVPEKPDNFLGLAETLLKDGNMTNAQALLDCINAFHAWNIPYERVIARFTKDAELQWRAGRAPLADW